MAAAIGAAEMIAAIAIILICFCAFIAVALFSAIGLLKQRLDLHQLSIKGLTSVTETLTAGLVETAKFTAVASIKFNQHDKRLNEIGQNAEKVLKELIEERMN